MSITPEKKSELMSEYALKKGDTGSYFVQCAILSERIRNLTEHLKVHKKDHHSKRGLMVLVCRRRNGLQYIRKKYGVDKYLEFIKRIGIRDIFH